MDEIGEMPLQLQAKLLHVLQENEFLPLGGDKMKRVDIRILAATNRDLEDMVAQKQFREDSITD
ncbi:Formate hydrogenlyase transcriptional activator [Virgibacillus salexigens]|uniref:Formate hydrogenlyase transcriptional activator n=1 Tax=Virgibacillus massiliensis TaxID=1462526 RepID=A0A024Q8F6_9BACI|nr:Formate hydrogenlyase transcriptional activator [Virgibacillus massiliensis]